MLTLRELILQDETAFLTGVKDWEGQDLSWFTFDWKPEIPFKDHLMRLKKNTPSVKIIEHIGGELQSEKFYETELLRKYTLNI